MASAAPPVSLRSSSGSSASSLSSTFSDITCVTDVSFSSSPPGAKTNAFFASPFNTRPPSPVHAQHRQSPAPSPPRSLTADFFATPARPPSPPASASTSTSPHKHTHHSQIHPSRIFPSRYTSTAESARSPEFSLLNLDDPAPHAYQPPPPSYHAYTHTRTPSDGSEDSITIASPTSSIFGQPRLPTPPPPPTPAEAQHHRRTPHREDTIVPSITRSGDNEVILEPRDDLTPRPAPREPTLLHFERSLLLAREAEAQTDAQRRLHPQDDPRENAYADEEEEEEEELKEGSIISLPPTTTMAAFGYGGAASPPPVRATPLPISPLALAFTLGPDPAPPAPSGQHDRGTPTPTPMGEPSRPSGSLASGCLSRDSPVAAVLPSHLHPQSGSHSPARPASLPSPLPSPSPSIPRSPSALALSLSTSSTSSISALPGYAYAQSPTSSLPPTPTPAPQLRLLRPLGHGAFSAVWLAEDLSRVPLTLVSRKSVRDLRRRASGRERVGAESEQDKDALREREREREKERERRARDREGARTPEPMVTPRNELDQRAAALDDTPRPPAARPSASILSLAGSASSSTPPSTLSASAVSAAPNKSPPRQSSRLREGLRNMLAFSRGAGAALMNSNASADASTNTDSSQLLEHEEHAETSQSEVEMDVDTDTDASLASPISRASSIRSVESFGPVSLSRASSVSVRLVGDSSADANTNTALLRDASLRKFRARVRGTRPALRLASGRGFLDERDGEMGVRVLRAGREGDGEDGDTDGEGSVLRASLMRKPNGVKAAGRLVAVKMTARRAPRTAAANASTLHGGSSGRREKEKERIKVLERQRRREEEERTRVRFVREVEVLKHISHPNITPLLAHLSTATYHILVLPYLPGGDLLGLVNNDVAWGKLSESVLRRIWIELCKAVGWMHGVGLVHRDIKLENILLTTSTFSALDPAAPAPTLAALPVPPAPFIKLTDFGLSRFVELDAHGDAEPLSTRCGSEAYAAPELVTGGGMYDARKTDAWACGVVLYALVGRVLPFGEGAAPPGQQTHSQKIGGERGEEQHRGATPAERRHWLMRIARGEWTWPGAESEEQQTVQASDQAASSSELVGARLVQSLGARRIVGRLLVRDTRKRARIADLWDDEWMRGGGEEGVWWRGRERETGKADSDIEMLNLRAGDDAPTWDGDAPEFWKDSVDVGFYDTLTGLDGLSEKDAARCEGAEDGAAEEVVVVVVVGEEGEEELEEEELEGEEEEDGCLLDQEGIDSITRQEVI